MTPGGRIYASSNSGIETFVEGYEGSQYARYIANQIIGWKVSGLGSDTDGSVYITVG